ncbi:hypothetical protein LJC22_01125 [Desulfosarcina sp. OttesenSCG-928-G10]|nr:hypothetical protein [Desulfosarcina sp. OttesenSCG-928-G10]
MDITFTNCEKQLTHLVSSERGLDGKLFVEFVALILISCIHQRMKAQNLYKKCTMHHAPASGQTGCDRML